MPDNRVTCRAHSTFHTRSNVWRKLRTPGHKLTTLKVKAKPLAPKCQITGKRLHGIKRAAPTTLTRCERTVARAYGGTMTMNVVKDKILRAFLCEESREAKKKATTNQKKK